MVEKRTILLIAFIMFCVVASVLQFKPYSYIYRIEVLGNNGTKEQKENYTKTQNNTEDTSRMQVLRQLMKQRVIKVQQKCKYIKDLLPEPTYKTWKKLFVNHHLKIVYCVLPKCGSSFLKSLVQKLEISINQTVTEYELNLDMIDEPERTYILKNYTKILIVRHPFSRLWSAYTSKIFMDRHQFLNVKKKIMKYSQEVTDNSVVCNREYSFKDFVRYIIRHRQTNNRHWRPMYIMSNPCHIEFDFIGHLETLDYDLDVLLNMIGIKAPQRRDSSGIEGRIDAGCRLNNKIKCMSLSQMAEKNYNYLTIEGLVEEEKDKADLLPLLTQWLDLDAKDKNDTASYKCSHYIRSLLTNTSNRQNISPSRLVTSRKKVARSKAFRSLSFVELSQLSHMYKMDFDIFDYNPNRF